MAILQPRAEAMSAEVVGPHRREGRAASPEAQLLPFTISDGGTASRWCYSKKARGQLPAAAAADCRHLVFKARKLRLPLPAELLALIGRFGAVDDVTLSGKGALLFVTYAQAAHCRAALAALGRDTACSALLGRGDRQGATVHLCGARDRWAAAGDGGTPTFAACPRPWGSHHLSPPPGLHVVEGFVSEAEQAALVGRRRCLSAEGAPLPWLTADGCLPQVRALEGGDADVPWSTNAGQRRVAHYGYTFSYASRWVDWRTPAPALPGWVAPLLGRLRAAVAPLLAAQAARAAAAAAVAGELSAEEASAMDLGVDQMTVNEYLPGQGIAAHVETHSAFLDGLYGVSLGSGVTMDFRDCNHTGGSSKLAPAASPEHRLLIAGVQCAQRCTHPSVLVRCHRLPSWMMPPAPGFVGRR
jgi:alkylated DNA repair dioxygenase AlkB